MEAAVRELCLAASRPYRTAGRFPYHFAQSKLRMDGVFFAILRSGLIPDGARVIDLGCGQSLLAAVLLAARNQFDTGVWPADWPIPPANLLLHGIELETEIAQWGRVALGDAVKIETRDIVGMALPACDVVVLLDVVHYLEEPVQRRLLADVAHALAGGGRLLLRVTNPSAGLAFRLTSLLDRFGNLTHFGLRRRSPQITYRSTAEWKSVLEDLGFQVGLEPVYSGPHSANVLLQARIHPAAGRSTLHAESTSITASARGVG